MPSTSNRLYTNRLTGAVTTTGAAWLVDGKPGNLQTLHTMRAIIRRDLGLDGYTQDHELRRFAARVVQNYGGGGYNWQARVRAIWIYVKRQFDYIPDPSGGNENLADARETIRDGWGDCDDLTILLCTLLGMVGVSTSLRMSRYRKGIDGFEHVYAVAHVPNGDLKLDVARADARIGLEAKFKEAFTLPVIEVSEQLRGVLDFLQGGAAIGGSVAQGGVQSGIATGAAIGLNFVPVVGPILSTLVGPIMGLFNKTARNKPFSDARDEWKDAIYNQQDAIRAAVDACQITPDEGAAASQEIIKAYYAACDKNFPKAIAQSCRNFESQDTPGGAQEGAFRTREKRIREAGKDCAAKKLAAQQAATNTTTVVDPVTGALVTSAPMLGGGLNNNIILLAALIVGAPLALSALRR